jgi:YVTN family beta-propeller protein
VTGTIDLIPEQVRSLSVSPDGKRVFVTSPTAGGVYVIRTSDNAVVDFVPLPGSDVFAGALTPDGVYMYVTERSSNDVALIRIANDTFLTTIPVPDSPQGIVSSPDGHFMYVTQANSGKVAVIRTSDNVVVDSIDGLPDSNQGNLDVTADGRFLYVVFGNPGGVSVVDIPAGLVIADLGLTEDFTSSIGRFIGPCSVDLGRSIPTLGEWGMIAAAAGLMIVGLFFAVRRRRRLAS